MVVYEVKRSILSRIFWPAFFCAALSYLGFNALNGNHGIYALLKEQHRLEAQKRELSLLTTERENLEHRVSLLSDKSLDLDLLEERARMVLGYSDKDEMIYIPKN